MAPALPLSCSQLDTSASIDRSGATQQPPSNRTALAGRFNARERETGEEGGREGVTGIEKVRIPLRPQLHSDITGSKKKRKREMGGTPLNRIRRKVLFTSGAAAAPL